MTEHCAAQARLTALISHSACHEHNMGAGHPESPERLHAVMDQLRASRIMDNLNEYHAPEATFEQLARVHERHYLDHLERHAPTKGTYRLDGDTAMSPGTLKAMKHAAGAVVQAVDLVMQGEAPNAFCAVRPPGHHAQSARAMGFCFVNHLAIGVMHALTQYGLNRVAIVDFDVHHGNGTEMIFKDNDKVMLLSSFQHPFYPYSGDQPQGGNPHIIGFPMPAGTRSEGFRQMALQKLLPALRAFAPEMIFISAGFDAHIEDDMSRIGLVEADYAWITQEIVAIARECAAGRIVSVLEGGYDLSSLGRSVAAHVKVLTQA